MSFLAQVGLHVVFPPYLFSNLPIANDAFISRLLITQYLQFESCILCISNLSKSKIFPLDVWISSWFNYKLFHEIVKLMS